MGVYQAIRQEKFYTQGQLKLTYIKDLSKTLIFRQLKTKFGNSCTGFFQTRKLTFYKTLLPAEKFGNINLHQQTVILKIIYDFRIEISFMEN